jgi:HEAT repeat protein
MATRTETRLGRSGARAFLKAGAACLAIAVCGCGGSKSTGELIESAKAKDSADRTRAVQQLADRKGNADTVIPALVQALQDEDAFVRRDAARALGRLGPAASTAAPALRGATRDKNLHVRQAATDSLRLVAP